MDQRLQLLENWLRNEQQLPQCEITAASGDASFRRYFRVRDRGASWIVMDAPPEREDCRPFVDIAQAMREMGLNVPAVLAADLEQGLLLLSDLGDRQYLAELAPATATALYRDALAALRRLQQASAEDAGLPPYSQELLLDEMALFRDWFLLRHLGLELDGAERAVLDEAFALLAASALEQPVVWVHRDFHSRNLMVVPDANPGILDFQDAVAGPFTYDLVSLLKDCYIAWPAQQVRAWALDYYQRAVADGIIGAVTPERFLHWFERMGVQRHLKAIGIFARLNMRDGKPGYLQDIPRTLDYVLRASAADSGLAAFAALLRERVLPVLGEQQGVQL